MTVLWTAVALHWCAGCSSAPALDEYRWLDAPATATGPAGPAPLDRSRWDQLEDLLRPGDIVLTTRNSAISVVERSTVRWHSFYTHSATIDVRDDDAVVSHAMGRFNLFVDSPRLFEKIVGTVESISLPELIRSYHDILIVRMPDASKNAAMAALTREYEAARIPFDSEFDVDDPSRMHCSEYTLHLLNEAGYEGLPQPAPITANRSILTLLDRLGLRYTKLIPLDRLIEMDGVQIVAHVSRYETPAMSAAIDDALEIIHDEFQADPDLRMGDFIGFNAKRLIHFTQATDLYFRNVEGMAQSSPTNDAAEIRRRNRIIYDETIRPLLTGGRHLVANSHE